MVPLSKAEQVTIFLLIIATTLVLGLRRCDRPEAIDITVERPPENRHNDNRGWENQKTEPRKKETAVFKVNLNTATADELESLSGIGPALARRIIEDRLRNGPYKEPKEVIRVYGIGEGIFGRIKDQVTTQ